MLGTVLEKCPHEMMDASFCINAMGDKTGNEQGMRYNGCHTLDPDNHRLLKFFISDCSISMGIIYFLYFHRLVCLVKDVDSGRRMECYSNQPGVQFYPGEFRERK